MYMYIYVCICIILRHIYHAAYPTQSQFMFIYLNSVRPYYYAHQQSRIPLVKPVVSALLP